MGIDGVGKRTVKVDANLTVEEKIISATFFVLDVTFLGFFSAPPETLVRL